MSHLSKALRAASAAALIGGFALAGTAPANADPNTGSASDINTLAGMLAKGYGPNNCKSGDVSGTKELAEFDCGQNPDPNGPAAAVYMLFGNSTDLSAAYSANLKDMSFNNCGGSVQSPGTWSQNGQTGGQVACGSYQGAAVILWTTDSKNMLGHLRGSSTDIGPLYKWWQSNT
ncbi:serine/threonine protein kinase [Mycobacterium sp.]|uniref:serine/threonine protein kinase n=1 Tax=Mycobacterium sp. TaxID=1785 RepID=UPI0025F0AADC|nr:serine/threonine protein kinase [Mycobacterium sp.]MBW0013897.1 serine/threonine protein kinase [Mycobacterium sp.]